MLRTLLKNFMFFGFVIAGYAAVESGYFSNDRTSRGQWDEIDRLKTSGKPKLVHDEKFKDELFTTGRSVDGYWDTYNGANRTSIKSSAGTLELTYTSPWVGTVFHHATFEPHGIYRLTIEAKVDDQPAALLMRNRQLDLLRQQIPTTNGEFKTHTFHYAAPGGRWDQVRLILIPDNRTSVKGRLTVRKFTIEKLES
jgi:hypothetical protein